MAKVGRKPKYRREMCEIAKQSLADGYSKEATAGILRVNKDTLYQWIKDKPDFSDAIKQGEALSQRWWEDRGREACADGQINGTVWAMNMKNRFGWSDKQDLRVGGEIDHKHTVEQLPETDSWLESIIGSGEETEDPAPRTH